jgi:hypothetical protein
VTTARFAPIALLSIAALTLPQPAAANGLLMSLCGGASVTIPIPGAPITPDDKGCCKGCHSSSDRRKKKDGNHDDGCC